MVPAAVSVIIAGKIPVAAITYPRTARSVATEIASAEIRTSAMRPPGKIPAAVIAASITEVWCPSTEVWSPSTSATTAEMGPSASSAATAVAASRIGDSRAQREEQDCSQRSNASYLHLERS